MPKRTLFRLIVPEHALHFDLFEGVLWTQKVSFPGFSAGGPIQDGKKPFWPSNTNSPPNNWPSIFLGILAWGPELDCVMSWWADQMEGGWIIGPLCPPRNICLFSLLTTKLHVVLVIFTFSLLTSATVRFRHRLKVKRGDNFASQCVLLPWSVPFPNVGLLLMVVGFWLQWKGAPPVASWKRPFCRTRKRRLFALGHLRSKFGIILYFLFYYFSHPTPDGTEPETTSKHASCALYYFYSTNARTHTQQKLEVYNAPASSTQMNTSQQHWENTAPLHFIKSKYIKLPYVHIFYNTPRCTTVYLTFHHN